MNPIVLSFALLTDHEEVFLLIHDSLGLEGGLDPVRSMLSIPIISGFIDSVVLFRNATAVWEIAQPCGYYVGVSSAKQSHSPPQNTHWGTGGR